MEMDKYVATYSRWVKSNTTQVVKEKAEQAMKGFLHEMPNVTQEESSRAYWVRYGYELYERLLFNQVTLEDVNRAREQGMDEVTYGAQDMVDNDLFKKKEGDVSDE